MKESIFNIKYHHGSSLLLFNTLSRSLVRISSRRFDRLLSGKEGPETDESKTLQEMGFLVDEVDEFKKYVFQYNLSAEDTRFLTVTYLTTMRCNFKCRYCFEGDSLHQKEEHSLIDSQTFERIYLRLLQLSHARYVDFTFFGGEPLLEFAHIVEVMSIFKRVNNENNISDSVNVVSNGYLLDEAMILKCKDIGVTRFQITVDGSREYHNRYRMLKDGRGTYDQIMSNIALLITHGLEVALNMNYCSENYLGIIEFLENVPSTMKSSVFVKFNELKTTALNDYAEKFSDDAPSVYGELYRTLKRLHFPDPEIQLNDYGPCMANRRNSVIISRNGDISKCVYGIGNPKFVLGSCLDNPEVLEEAFHEYVNDVRYSEKCKVCSVLPICKGGCQRLRLESESGPAPICEYDRIYHTIVDTVLQYYEGES